MLASIFGRRRSAARRSAIRIPAAAEVEPEEQQEQREAAKRKRKRSSAAPAPTPAPAPRRSTTSGAARRRQAKEAAATTNGVEVATAATAATVSTSPAIPAVLAVAVFGDTTLEPWTTFELLKGGGKFPQILTSYMAKFKAFKEPTAFQAHCWPYACAGRHVIGISKTGSGKTLAFLLPALRKVLSFKHAATPSFGPYALVLTPTRELAIQIARDATGLCKATRIRMACLYGGTSKAQQIKSLDFGVDLLICTPGRLHDLVNKPDKYTGQSILSLSMVHFLVLDEADCLLELGFEHQVRHIFQQLADHPQILCFSATWPKKVQTLTEEMMPKAVHIRVGAESHEGITGNQDVRQHVRLLRREEDRFKELCKILRSHQAEASIIFCGLKKTAAALSRWLREEGFSCGALHGNLTQPERQEVMERFRQEEVNVLVATDVAARGLDLKRVSVVVSYEPAVSLDAHVHRIGRTGRAGKKGEAYSLLQSEDVTTARLLVQSFQSAGQAIPEAVLSLSQAEPPAEPNSGRGTKVVSRRRRESTDFCGSGDLAEDLFNLWHLGLCS